MGAGGGIRAKADEDDGWRTLETAGIGLAATDLPRART